MYGWPFSNRYLVAFISTLAAAFLSLGLCIEPLWREGVTQTWLMRRYWLWLLWQLLIRDWLETVTICWVGQKETGLSDLVELILLHPLTVVLGEPAAAFEPFNSESSVKFHTKKQAHAVRLQSTTWCRTTHAERRLKLIRSSTTF